MSLQVAKSREAVRSMTLPRCGDGAVPKIRDRTRSASRIVLADRYTVERELGGTWRSTRPDRCGPMRSSHFLNVSGAWPRWSSCGERSASDAADRIALGLWQFPRFNYGTAGLRNSGTA